MADLQHATLPDERLHYPKGANTASNNTWMKANGDGTTSFETLPTTLSVEDVLQSASTVVQEMVSPLEEVQLTFGASATSPNGHINITATGEININTTGVYDIIVARNAGKSSATGVHKVSFGIRKNGSQLGQTALETFEASVSEVSNTSSQTGIVQLNAGDVLTYHMLYSDKPGPGAAGVYPELISTAGWLDIPSIAVAVSKLEV